MESIRNFKYFAHNRSINSKIHATPLLGWVLVENDGTVSKSLYDWVKFSPAPELYSSLVEYFV